MLRARVPIVGREFERFCIGPIRSVENWVFKTQAHMLVFAASIGAEADRFVESPETKSDSIEEKTFASNHLLDRMRIIALAKSMNNRILDNDQDVSDIVEGYAAAGFQIMNEWLEDCGEDEFFLDYCKQEILKRMDPELQERKSE